MKKHPTISLIEALQNPALYDHPVQGFHVVETHISWVLLTGLYAYKLKKPVDLGFLDFSTLEKRRFFCEEELRLNQRLAPELYLAVVPITGTTASPALGGAGPIIDYAVKMREFPQNAQLDRALTRGEVNTEHMIRLARAIAQFHAHATVAAADSPFGSAQEVWQPAAQNFEQIRPHLDTAGDHHLLEKLRAWSEQTHAKLTREWEQRKRDGFIRECHGDMHLGNMALVDGKILIFDCIEFNERLRWIDVMSEAAFVTMDLYDRGRPGLAHRFLNDYLQHSGDYAGLKILRFYQVYRALVRAKVACLRLTQAGLSAEERNNIRAHYRQYLNLAERYTHPIPTPLIITHGLSGSGKTTFSDALLESSGAIRIRSDVERKRLYGLSPEERSASDIASGLYSSDASIRTYKRLATLARIVISAGFPVIVDAAFLQERQRRQFRELAESLQVPFVIFHCTASPEQLRERLRLREAQGRDASEATLSVLEHQLATQEILRPEEAAHIFNVANEAVR
jgi:aminoglycoside phosphotransferase family enzyme/adenylate kinase family enzyme